MGSKESRRSTVEGRTSVRSGVFRLVGVVILIVLELAVMLTIAVGLYNYSEELAVLDRLFATFLVWVIYSQNKAPALKMTWIMIIMASPVIGVALYIIIGGSFSLHSMRKRYNKVDDELFPLLPRNDEQLQRLKDENVRAGNIATYLRDYAHHPTYDNTDIEYYDDAAKGLEAQKEELRRAENFIFMEYHAIENAESWQGIQEILEERAKAGVDVRVFYDDMGSIGFINVDFVKQLESRGIRCRVFNPFKLGLDLFLNNRDHRKITVIDGRVGFTGGYNLANEYFNITSPYGHWKDTGIKITGDAVKSLTVAFLEMWNAVRGDDENDADFTQYLPDLEYHAKENGFVVPYADSPLDGEVTGENVYLSMVECAQSYVWLITPYLILTDEMIRALGLAAKRGVDVRIITPGIPDKKLVYAVTRSYYNGLVCNGVRVYEYTPGFCHCKMGVVDDMMAVCGTINLDYRSLYHHFENACLYVGCDAVTQTRRDFERTMAECQEVTQDYKDPWAVLRLWHLVLRFFAPLI